MYKEVILDVETKNLFRDIESEDPGKLGISIVSLYERTINQSLLEIHGSIQSFWENELERMWNILVRADRIIGFNTLHFDMPTLQPYTKIQLASLKHLDMMQSVKNSIGRRLPLDLIARDTLGVEKNDTGSNAVLYYRKGDQESLKKLRNYCEHDVLITKQLYDFGIKNGFLRYKDKWNNVSKIPVDFLYRKTETNNKAQIDLF
jgi:DEAD/DEAH box helicase domain-containing protein